MPALQFFPLEKLTLGGDRYKKTIAKVLALNDLRNEFGHELEENELEARMATLAKHAEVFWPETDLAGAPAQFRSLRDSAVRIAALSVPGDVWVNIVEFSLDNSLYPSQDGAEEAHAALERGKQRISEQRKQQAAMQAVYESLRSK